MPSFTKGISTYYIIAPAEASANLARYDGIRYTPRAQNTKTLWEMYAKTRGSGFGAEVKRRILLGTYVLSAGYYDDWFYEPFNPGLWAIFWTSDTSGKYQEAWCRWLYWNSDSVNRYSAHHGHYCSIRCIKDID